MALVADLAVVAVFLVVIGLPGSAMLCGIDRATVSESEMRELAELPPWSWRPSGMLVWLDGFQRYFADHFAFRGRLIHWQAVLLWKGLRTSSSDTVIAGKDGWLFYADDGGLDDWIKARPFTADELEAWRLMLQGARDWLEARGIAYLFVIAPDKHVIYPEKMPGSLRRMRGDDRADQLIAYLRERSTVEVLDLRPAVIAAKKSELLYHLYDTHWNDRGALVAYREIALALGRCLPSVRPLTRADFDESPTVSSGDKTTLLGLVDRGKEAMPGLVPRRGWSWRVVEPREPDPYGEDGRVVTEIPGSSLPRAVMFRDSFAGRLMPYLSEHFSHIVYLWQKSFETKVVREEHPDVVIQEMVGRHLFTDTPYPDSIPPNEEAS